MTATARKHTAPDPLATARQNQAAAIDPRHSVWVGASAGSGKTTVLANRVLRLLLPEERREAADPAKLICITFTKAAASEVLERIMRHLRAWTIAPAGDLEETLEKLLGKMPDENQIAAARALFARVLEVPGGMKILTIHAFCQSILARFPMEAGLPAGFEVMDEAESAALMTSIRHDLIAQTRELDETAPLRRAFETLSTLKNAKDLEKLLASLAAERGRLAALRTRHGGTDGLCSAVYAYLAVAEIDTRESLIAAFMKGVPADDLRAVLPKLTGCKTKTNQKYFGVLDRFLAANTNMRISMHADYRLVFLNKSDGMASKLVGTLANDSFAMQVFGRESVRLQALDSKLRDLATAEGTASLLRFALTALDAYDVEKRKRNRLDYEDLIDRTRKLLGNGGVHWVHYKLDGGIDHVLVDEAQDTNPDQWDIVTALTDEFFDGTSAREQINRTVFVVGDEKQSIFSFQRADPRVFDAMRVRLKEKTESAQAGFREVPMSVSFRSAPSVLHAVDGVFAPPEMLEGVVRTGEHMEHTPFLSGKAGRVEIWPVLKAEETPEREAWYLPTALAADTSPVAALAEKIALKIRDLLDNPNEILPSKDRRIRPGDIMILLAKRKPLADAILKALRKHDIPIGGIDRMVVTKQIAVRDVLAALSYALQPLDDLTLATLLKSPFVGLDDDALYALCHGRTGTLQNALRTNGQYAHIVAWLEKLRTSAGNKTVSAFLHDALYTPCPADAQSGLKALSGRLGVDIRDPLQELLARADTFDMSDARGLQGFLDDALRDESEIKRQMSEDGNCVRLMTVHGSKGLEAPIVFMPDTIRATNAKTKSEPILWPDRDETDGLPLWSPNADMRADACKARVADAQIRADEEYRRLLYVAMTRAGERLYIAGMDKYKSGKADRITSWYDRIAPAFTDGVLGNVEKLEDGTFAISNPQTDKSKTDDGKAAPVEAAREIPVWAKTLAPAPDFPPRPLAPSKPEGDEPAALSPLYGDTSWRWKRGRVIHTLFQFLPDLPQEKRRARAAEWLARPAHDFDDAARHEILESVMAVLEDASFAPLFTANARAEVPLTGLLSPTHIVSGQIDRLLVEETKVLVLDYKTNRPAPEKIGDVPEAYKRQMRTYRDLLVKIWPEKEIRCALLWTDGPRLMDLTDAL